MLNPIYKPIKAELNTIDDCMDVQWFNMQYEGQMPYERGYFIEFPDQLDFEQISKDAQRSDLRVRIHAYTKVAGDTDGIPDSAVDEHETFALAAKDKLKGFKPTDKTTLLRFRGWKHHHKWKGWMVTFVDFTCKYTL